MGFGAAWKQALPPTPLCGLALPQNFCPAAQSLPPPPVITPADQLIPTWIAQEEEQLAHPASAASPDTVPEDEPSSSRRRREVVFVEPLPSALHCSLLSAANCTWYVCTGAAVPEAYCEGCTCANVSVTVSCTVAMLRGLQGASRVRACVSCWSFQGTAWNS